MRGVTGVSAAGSASGEIKIAPRWFACYKTIMGSPLETSEAAILDRVFRPNAADWSRAVAEAVLKIQFDPSDRERMTRVGGNGERQASSHAEQAQDARTLQARRAPTGTHEVEGATFFA